MCRIAQGDGSGSGERAIVPGFSGDSGRWSILTTVVRTAHHQRSLRVSDNEQGGGPVEDTAQRPLEVLGIERGKTLVEDDEVGALQ